MPALVCGSLAFDSIATFGGRFADQIMPNQLHVLNVSFLVPSLRREFGGCAGNIAYNLAALGGEPVIVAAVGADGADYLARLRSWGTTTEHVLQVGDAFTAQAFIITDFDDNQITAFHPGAMNASHENRVGDVADIALGIVAPDGREGMRSHVEQFANARIPFMFDPGQGMPLFSGPELVEMIDAASFVAVNDYEASLLSERTGLSVEAIARRVDALIVTLGGAGARIHAEGSTLDIPAVTAESVVDPTGCGDAFRAGLLYGIASGWDWQRSGRLASTLGALKIASRGGQNHALTRDRVATAYHEAFHAHLF